MRFLPTALLLLMAAPTFAADPLRFLPESMPLVVKVERPRELVESVVRHDLAKQALKLGLVRDFLDRPEYRKFFQILAHVEKELGVKWPEMIDQVAGGGMALGATFGGDNAPALLAVEGKEEATVKKFLEVGLSLLGEELERLGSNEKPVMSKRGVADVVRFGNDLHIARVGPSLLLTNKREALDAALDQGSKRDPNPRPAKESKQLLDGKPVAWVWVDMKPVKELPEAKDLFASPRNEIVLTLAAAGWLDVAKRSDFIAAGLYHDKGDFHLSVRMPAGREGMAPDVELHLPRDAKAKGTLPLLEPKGVAFSHSFYFDLDTLYQKRDGIFPAGIAKDFAEGEKEISRFLLGTTLPKFLANSGVHWRIVATQPEKVESYKTEPGQRLPAVAVVLAMKDKQFGRTMNGLIRAAALALGEQINYKGWEEEIDGIRVFGYSFPDGGKFPDDPTGLRFNYQPCFGVVGDQYVAASNKGLFKELVGILQKEDRSKPERRNMQMRLHAGGVGDFLLASPDLAVADSIVSGGLKLSAAREEAKALTALVKNLGTVSLETDYDDRSFRFDLHWRTGK